MSRSQLTILTNICLIEDIETQRVVMQYRAPETNRWSGYAFPGGHVENGEAFAESVIREIAVQKTIGKRKFSSLLLNNLADPRPPRYSGGLVVFRLQLGDNGCHLSIQTEV